MENKKIYNDDVERIVNEPERQRAIGRDYCKRKAKVQRKMLLDSFVFVVLSFAFGFLGIFGLLVAWLAFPIFSVCGLCAAFSFGRWFENGKRWGWK